MIPGRSPSIAWRPLLVLGRVSNLPTVWSNCLAGWWLSGTGGIFPFLLLGLGATFFYLGGMYLNDAFDVRFDREFRRERPIPSGQITRRWVWIMGWLQLVLGALLFRLGAGVPLWMTLLLGASIILYDGVHKWITFSPMIMAACRFFLFLSAASIGVHGVTGTSLWSAIALSTYILGLSYVARRESLGGIMTFWPCLLLAAPLILAGLINNGSYRLSGAAFSLVLVGWVLYCLRFIYGPAQVNIGRGVSGLLAGITLVDLLAILGGNPPVAILLFFLFGLANLLQRFIPAT